MFLTGITGSAVYGSDDDVKYLNKTNNTSAREILIQIRSETQTHLLQLRLQLTALLFFLFNGDLQGLELGILL